MKKSLSCFCILATLNLVACKVFSQNALQVSELTCNHFSNPSGVIDPVFGWKMTSVFNGQSQSAYQLIVASSQENISLNKGDVWDTKKVQSSDQLNIPLPAGKLASSTTYFWKVKVWDKKGKASSWSVPAYFITGIVKNGEFKGDWISSNKEKGQPSPLFRKTFVLNGKPQDAIIHISGLGYYELYVNGRKVGDHVLDPAQTNYDDYAFYVTYRIDTLLKKGDNVIGVMLGSGFYDQDMVWGGNMGYGKPLLWCQLDIKTNTGIKQLISDSTWQYIDGPILQDNVYAGETYDARKEIAGWSSSVNVRGNWRKVELATTFPPVLKPQSLQAIKKMKEIAVKRFYKLPNGSYVFDMGQNFAGWNRLKIKAPAGTEIMMRMAEEVENDTLAFATTGVKATKVIQTEKYTCKGGELEVWEPRFTYHGFRYVEVSGLPATPTKDLLTGIVVYSSMPDAGHFSCSDQQINKLHELSHWTLTSNLHGIPTDCPAREKCGWLGDAHAVARSTIYNFDMQNFWLKFMNDIRSTAKPVINTIRHTGKAEPRLEKFRKPSGIPTMVAPGKRFIGTASPDWGTAIVQIPWSLYMYYGDTSALRSFYPGMKQWAEYVGNLKKAGIVYQGLGDWCPPGTISQIDCPVPLSSTAFHYNDLIILKNVAEILGKKKDREIFNDSALIVRKAFIKDFYNQNTHSFGSHTANAMALDFGLVPTGDEQMVANAIVKSSNENFDGIMYAGIFGLQRLFDQLSRHGNEEKAYEMLTKKGDNSFELMWTKYKATTLWEVLPVSTVFVKQKPTIVSDVSHNHPMQAGFDSWFFSGIGGIQPDITAPGFKKIIFEPKLINQLQWAKADYNSGYGKIISNWNWEGKNFIWEVSVPVNTTAEIHLPKQFSQMKIDDGGKIKIDKSEDSFNYHLSSGNYRLIFN